MSMLKILQQQTSPKRHAVPPSAVASATHHSEQMSSDVPIASELLPQASTSTCHAVPNLSDHTCLIFDQPPSISVTSPNQHGCMPQVIEHDRKKARRIIQKLSPAPKCATGRNKFTKCKRQAVAAVSHTLH
jgi:hypothetical protein